MIVLCHEFCAPLEVAVNLYQRVLEIGLFFLQLVPYFL